jgi:hypothetical protein
MLESLDRLRTGNWVVVSWFLKKGKIVELKNTMHRVFLKKPHPSSRYATLPKLLALGIPYRDRLSPPGEGA